METATVVTAEKRAFFQGIDTATGAETYQLNPPMHYRDQDYNTVAGIWSSRDRDVLFFPFEAGRAQHFKTLKTVYDDDCPALTTCEPNQHVRVALAHLGYTVLSALGTPLA
jgi:hypothetical protein